MLKFKKFLIAHKLITVCLAILMFGSIAFASNYFSNKSGNCFWYQSNAYYSDATYTTQVGTKAWFCNGQVGTGGTITQYYITTYCDCIEEP